MRKDVPSIPPADRQILEEKGFLKRPGAPSLPAPNVVDLLTKAAAKRFEITLTASAEEGDDRKRRLSVHALVADEDGQFWEASNGHPGVALAIALANALRDTVPAQTSLPGGVAAMDAARALSVMGGRMTA